MADCASDAGPAETADNGQRDEEDALTAFCAEVKMMVPRMFLQTIVLEAAAPRNHFNQGIAVLRLERDQDRN
ncbi:MAG: hypothetical protein M1826_000819 [Phylliscum demangeonii]|nr:MAG: hypothetical protein M1826_000819 [Phylliscum demangeonii]